MPGDVINYVFQQKSHLGLGSSPCSVLCSAAFFGGLLTRFFQQQSMSRPWSLFSSSAGSLREMCMASLISKVVVWLAQSRIRVSSQRAWWCIIPGHISLGGDLLEGIVFLAPVAPLCNSKWQVDGDVVDEAPVFALIGNDVLYLHFVNHVAQPFTCTTDPG